MRINFNCGVYVPHEILIRQDISRTAKLFLGMLIVLEPFGGWYGGWAETAHLLGTSVTHAKITKKQLEDDGWLESLSDTASGQKALRVALEKKLPTEVAEKIREKVLLVAEKSTW